MHSDPNRTTPIGMARYAVEYFSAAEDLFQLDEHKAADGLTAKAPVLFLIGHSIELSLKAYLLREGLELESLRKKYGHNLLKCFKEAKNRKLCDHVSFEPVEVETLGVLNDIYYKKELEYISTGPKKFPVYGHVASLCEKLASAVATAVGYRYNESGA